MDGDGPTRQDEAIKKFCAAHKVDLSAVFTEDGVSGTTAAMDRAAFSKMVEFIEQVSAFETVEAVVVERLDRLARDLMVSEFLLKELRERGIKVFAADQGALIDMANDQGDPTRKLIRQIIAALSEWEKSNLVLKLRIARQRKKALTGWVGGNKPYGRDHTERTILSLIMVWRKEGFSYSRIVRLLNDGGFTNRNGGKWKKSNLVQIVKYAEKKNSK